MSETLARDPLSLQAIDALGWVRYHRGEYDVSVPDFSDLLAEQPRYQALLQKIGLA